MITCKTSFDSIFDIFIRRTALVFQHEWRWASRNRASRTSSSLIGTRSLKLRPPNLSPVTKKSIKLISVEWIWKQLHLIYSNNNRVEYLLDSSTFWNVFSMPIRLFGWRRNSIETLFSCQKRWCHSIIDRIHQATVEWCCCYSHEYFNSLRMLAVAPENDNSWQTFVST